MLKPGNKGKTHRAYLWVYTPSSYDGLHRRPLGVIYGGDNYSAAGGA